MSLSSELIVGGVHMFATTFEAEQRVSLHQAKKCSLLRGYQGHDALLVFKNFFKKNPDNCVEIDRTSKRFFNGNSISQKVKMTACVE
jgi:hypothetical protein